MNRKFPAYVSYLFSYAVALLAILTAFRLVLLFIQQAQLIPESEEFIMKALFNRGLLFDSSVVSYVTTPIFLILSISNFVSHNSPRLYRLIKTISILLVGILMLLCCADIPYYNYYNSRLTNSVFTLAENDSMWLVITDLFTNKDYLPFTLTFIVLMFGIWKFIGLLNSKMARNETGNAHPLWKKISCFVVIGYLIFSGIRGNVNPDAKPLKLEHAYISDFTFINQLGLNPVFSFIDSYRAFKIDFIDDNTAIKNVQDYLNITPSFDSPIARKVQPNGNSISPNVVLVLMESMSANKMGHYGNKNNLTPYLDNIAKNSLTYNNIYTAGIHTHNGIYSSITGMPALMHNTPMFSAQTSTQTFSGLSNILDKEGYQSIFFITGKRNFDNMQGFLPKNGYDELISKKDHPKEQWINRWGIPDHHLFNNSIAKLDSLSSQSKPFLATFMTVSTHNPYSIPKGIDFHPKSNNAIDKSYEYADWSIGQFMETAKSKPWFDNTIFVFIGDHGQNFDPIYSMPLAYHHTPMIFYSPKYIQPSIQDKIGLQIDLFPTLLGIMNTPYVNNTLGVNLRTNSRPFVYFSADDKLACLNEDYYLIMNKRGKEALYNYKEKSTTNEASKHPELTAEMKNYTYSMLQTTQWMIENRKISMQKK